ncbi:MAG: heterodisulfide reductase-related iron-sulfur binding cluster [Salinivirgaceae bacterium]|nr:heterodisulfide reductase-related iron-sulfur binding cluster [Salinivirgaceae bacterium]
MAFDPLVIPFSLGLIFLLIVVFYKYYTWIRQMPKPKNPPKGLNRIKAYFDASIEVIMESLLHRKIFKQNKLLGYMHMSIAFGWFMLIVVGNLEAKMTSTNAINPPYFPIFLNFFAPDRSLTPGHGIFSFTMDLFLAMVLSGLLLAFIKRSKSRLFGMRRTSKMRGMDKIALYSLWLIFPLRLFAESFNAYNHNSGNFLSANCGDFFATFLPVAQLEYSMWVLYSLSLGVFFVALPWSRYSHIPTEVVLIFIRHLGYRSCVKPTGYNMFDLYSCSRCGICIDQCQINILSETNKTVTAHYIYDMRVGNKNDFGLYSCLACGRCEEACPVGIKAVDLRIGKRYSETPQTVVKYNVPKPLKPTAHNVGYFSGCMGKLTPSVIESMHTIFRAANENVLHIDKEDGICCGRPLILSGRVDQAAQLIQLNKDRIVASGIKTLVTSCPICLKTFKEDYDLNIEVIHHSEYIEQLLETRKIKTKFTNQNVAYHDPCELGRGLKIYDAPRNVIRNVAILSENPNKNERELCCGGSLAGIALSQEQKQTLASDAIHQIIDNETKALITSCPLCKKSFTQTSVIKVMDIAEIISQNLILPAEHKVKEKQHVQEFVNYN